MSQRPLCVLHMASQTASVRLPWCYCLAAVALYPEDLEWLSDCHICLSAAIVAFQLLLIESLMPLGGIWLLCLPFSSIGTSW